VVLSDDPTVGQVRMAAARACDGPPEEREQCIEETVAAHKESRNLNEPIHERYARWLVDGSTFDWGFSFSRAQPVTDLIADRLPYTLMYVVPAMALSSIAGVAAGALLGLREGSWLDRIGTVVSYAGLGVPNFWLATVLLWYFTQDNLILNGAVDPSKDLFAPANLEAALLPTLVLATSLFAGQMRYARAETLERAGAEFVNLLHAKGFGERGVGKRILRVAAAPLASLLFVDLLGVLVINVYVIEYVFAVPGFGALSYRAILQQDLPLVLGTAMTVALVGIVGSLLQDAAYSVLDPRVADDEP
jgi:peptide/nickel transport system permease protein